MVLLWLGIDPKTKQDGERLRSALPVLLAAEPTLVAHTRASGGVTMIGADSDEQLERVVDRLAREFGVAAGLSRLEIAYKEALTTSAVGEARYAEQIDGRGHYAHVRIAVRPGEPRSGVVFENAIVGSAIPAEFVAPIADALRQACERGVLAGYPIEDVHITLCDGSHHDADSSADAFRTAAGMAFTDAASRAKPVLFEPIMRVLLVVPADREARARALLTARGAVPGPATSVSRRRPAIAGQMPLAATFGLAREVLAVTASQGLCEIRFSHYAPVTADEDGDRDLPVREPRSPSTPPRVRRAAVAEPVDATSEEDDDGRAVIVR